MESTCFEQLFATLDGIDFGEPSPLPSPTLPVAVATDSEMAPYLDDVLMSTGLWSPLPVPADSSAASNQPNASDERTARDSDMPLQPVPNASDERTATDSDASTAKQIADELKDPFEEFLSYSPDSTLEEGESPVYEPKSPDVNAATSKCLEEGVPSPKRRRHSPIRAPAVTALPSLSLKRREPPRQEGFKRRKRQHHRVPVFEAPSKQVFRHRLPFVLALREGEYVLTDGHRSWMRRDGKNWSRLLSRDLMDMKLYMGDLFCADLISYNLLKRERRQWIASHPIHTLKFKRLEEKKQLGLSRFCENPTCLRWLAIKGGIQRFVAYEINVPEH